MNIKSGLNLEILISNFFVSPSRIFLWSDSDASELEKKPEILLASNLPILQPAYLAELIQSVKFPEIFFLLFLIYVVMC